MTVVREQALAAGWAPSESEDFERLWRATHPQAIEPPQAFERGALLALVGREPVVDGDWRWHVSVSCSDRLPRWGELVDAAHTLRPGVVFVVGVPPRSWWLNLHPYVLHLWETTDAHLVSEWRSNASGDEPT